MKRGDQRNKPEYAEHASEMNLWYTKHIMNPVEAHRMKLLYQIYVVTDVNASPKLTYPE